VTRHRKQVSPGSLAAHLATAQRPCEDAARRIRRRCLTTATHHHPTSAERFRAGTVIAHPNPPRDARGWPGDGANTPTPPDRDSPRSWRDDPSAASRNGRASSKRPQPPPPKFHTALASRTDCGAHGADQPRGADWPASARLQHSVPTSQAVAGIGKQMRRPSHYTLDQQLLGTPRITPIGDHPPIALNDRNRRPVRERPLNLSGPGTPPTPAPRTKSRPTLEGVLMGMVIVATKCPATARASCILWLTGSCIPPQECSGEIRAGLRRRVVPRPSGRRNRSAWRLRRSVTALFSAPASAKTFSRSCRHYTQLPLPNSARKRTRPKAQRSTLPPTFPSSREVAVAIGDGAWKEPLLAPTLLTPLNLTSRSIRCDRQHRRFSDRRQARWCE